MFNQIAEDESRFQYWSELINRRDLSIVAEIGVWRGTFASQILDLCPRISRYYMVDPWRPLDDWNKPLNVSEDIFNQSYREAIDRTMTHQSKIHVIREESKLGMEQIEPESLDFAYVDGDHTMRGIILDLISVLPRVKEGGIIGGDDFSSTPWQHEKRFEPTMVFPTAVHIAEAYDYPIYALGKSQFLIHKVRGEGFRFVDLTSEYQNKTSLNGFFFNHL